MIREHGAAEFDAVGALDHQRQRAGHGIALAVAQQRGQVHRLVGTIDAAFGIDERIGARRHGPAGNAAIAEIERAGFQAEEGVVGFLAAHRQHRRRQAALAASEACLEQHVTGIIGFAGGQNLVVAGDQPHLCFCDCIGRGQRIDEDVDAVIAGECGDAEIGNDEPLCRQRPVVVAAGPFGRSRQDVDARLQIAQRLIDRKCCGDVLIERGCGGEFA